MARRYGQLNRYDSQIRRCAVSGLRFYQSEMVYVNGKYIHPKYLDEDETRRPRDRRIGRRDR